MNPFFLERLPQDVSNVITMFAHPTLSKTLQSDIIEVANNFSSALWLLPDLDDPGYNPSGRLVSWKKALNIDFIADTRRDHIYKTEEILSQFLEYCYFHQYDEDKEETWKCVDRWGNSAEGYVYTVYD
jgi:hypothetical protein